MPPRDEIQRLRALLKVALRCHGWRAVEVLDAGRVEVVVKKLTAEADSRD